MRHDYEFTSAIYHSHLWSLLTEMGWVTMTVDGEVARMCRRLA